MRNGSTRHMRVLRARVLRDSDVCHICGQPGADSVDHVLPVVRRPDLAYDLSNLRPAHLVCNKRKSDKDYAPIIRRSGSLN